MALNLKESLGMEAQIQQDGHVDVARLGEGGDNYIMEENDDDDDIVLPQLSQAYTTTVSQRNGIVLHNDRHSYTVNKKGKFLQNEGENENRNIDMSWLCQNRKTSRCNGRIKVDKITKIDTGAIEFENFRLTTEHSDSCNEPRHHVAHVMATTQILFRTAAGEDFRQTYNDVVTLGQHSMRNMDLDAANEFRSRQSLARTARRRGSERYPSDPSSADIEFPDNWKHLTGDISEPLFLLVKDTFVYNNASYNIIILGTEERFHTALCQSPIWLVDGTFKTCPPQFKQFFSIHMFIGSRAITCLYVLLPGKATFVYDRLWHLIKQKATQLQIHEYLTTPKRIKVDFEIAIRNSLMTAWNNWIIECCYFHFCQALKHWIETHGLKVCLYLELHDTMQ